MLIWLSVSTWSDLTPVISLLSPYQSGLSPGHLNAAKYAGHSLKAAKYYGLVFSSYKNLEMESYIHFPLDDLQCKN